MCVLFIQVFFFTQTKQPPLGIIAYILVYWNWGQYDVRYDYQETGSEVKHVNKSKLNEKILFGQGNKKMKKKVKEIFFKLRFFGAQKEEKARNKRLLIMFDSILDKKGKKETSTSFDLKVIK